MKLVYQGDSLEVELLQTGKRFPKGVPVEVTEYEAQLLKDHPDFKQHREKKGADK